MSLTRSVAAELWPGFGALWPDSTPPGEGNVLLYVNIIIMSVIGHHQIALLHRDSKSTLPILVAVGDRPLHLLLLSPYTNTCVDKMDAVITTTGQELLAFTVVVEVEVALQWRHRLNLSTLQAQQSLASSCIEDYGTKLQVPICLYMYNIIFMYVACTCDIIIALCLTHSYMYILTLYFPPSVQ